MKVKISHSQIAGDTQELDLSVETPRGKDCVIGRSPDADFVLDDPDVSRFHCKFFYQSGNYYFCDLGSRNGSTFNNKVLQKDQSQLLNNGDIIRIGDYILVMEDTASMEQPAETVVRIINPALFSQKPSTQNVETEKPEIIVNEAPENIETPVVEEINTTDETENIIPENIIPENITSESVEVDEVQQTEIETPPQTEQENIEVENVEAENIETNISETEDSQAFAVPEYTIVQPRDIPLPLTESPSKNSEDSSHDFPENELTYETQVQERNQEEIEEPTETANEIEESPNSELEAVESETSIQDENPVEDIEQQQEENQETTEAIEEYQTVEVEQMEYNSEAEVLEEISQVDVDATPEAESTEPEETSETTSENALPTVVTEKYTVLIAHDSKEAELVDFVNKHQELLSSCLTMTWNSVSENLKQQTGVNISEEIPAATSGGYQRIVSLINSNEVLAVIFIRDLLQPQPGQANEETFLRLCNINNVLLATNLATAEAVVCHMKHGLCN